MKYVKILFAVVLVFTLCSAFSLKKGNPKEVYAFGISTSFTDTVVYYTDIQLMDSIKLDKNGFLPHRDAYSFQLKSFLEFELNKTSQTSMMYFSENKSKLEREAGKVLDRYKKNKSLTLVKVDTTKFRFTKPVE
ncbi:MAG: hypothetical protein RR365_03830 [Bacteroides sp.]